MKNLTRRIDKTVSQNHRILIIGPGGAGKTTVARKIGQHLNIEVVHLDAFFWQPGWVATPPETWQQVVQQLVKRSSWVMDGNYGGTLDYRLDAADTVVFLDLPPALCIWRVIKRRLRYHGKTRPEMGTGCPERLTIEFLWWIWTYRKKRRPGILAKLGALGPQKRVFVLRSPREVTKFLGELPQHAG